MVGRPFNLFYKAWFLPKGPGFILTIALITTLTAGCDRKPSTPEGTERPAAVTWITTIFKYEVSELPQDQVSWSTYWKFCWEQYPGAEW